MLPSVTIGIVISRTRVEKSTKKVVVLTNRLAVAFFTNRSSISN